MLENEERRLFNDLLESLEARLFLEQLRRMGVKIRDGAMKTVDMRIRETGEDWWNKHTELIKEKKKGDDE